MDLIKLAGAGVKQLFMTPLSNVRGRTAGSNIRPCRAARGQFYDEGSSRDVPVLLVRVSTWC